MFSGGGRSMPALQHRPSNARPPVSKVATKQLHIVARPVHRVSDSHTALIEPLQQYKGLSTETAHAEERGRHEDADQSHYLSLTACHDSTAQQHSPQQVHIAPPGKQHSFQYKLGARQHSPGTSGRASLSLYDSHSTGIHASELAKAYVLLLKQYTQEQRQQHLQVCNSRRTDSSIDSSHPGMPKSFTRTPSDSGALPQLQTELQQLMQDTYPVLQQLQPQQASLMLYTATKVGEAVPTSLVDGLLGQLQLQQLPSAGVTNTLWSLAVLSFVPVDAATWFNSFYKASSGLLQGDHFNHHQLTSLVWSVGKLKQQPPADWIELVLAKLRPGLSKLSNTELSNTLWGLAQISYRPDNTWCKDWFRASYKALPSCTVHHLACMVGSLGLLRLSTASGSWLVRFRQCVQQQLLQLESNHIATIMCGLAKRCSCQPPHWVGLLLRRQLQLLTQPQHTAVESTRAAAAALPDVESSHYLATANSKNLQQQRCRAADIAATIWALPRLLFPTGKSWGTEPQNATQLRLLATVSLPLLSQCTAGELVQLAVGFAGLDYHPGTHWLKVHENAIAARYSALSSNDKAKLRAAIKTLWLGG